MGWEAKEVPSHWSYKIDKRGEWVAKHTERSARKHRSRNGKSFQQYFRIIRRKDGKEELLTFIEEMLKDGKALS
jgi:hypothetical protein